MFVSARLIRRFGPLPLLALAAAISARLLVYALFPARGAIIAAQLLHSLFTFAAAGMFFAFRRAKRPP